jgi:hypothetical protein
VGAGLATAKPKPKKKKKKKPCKNEPCPEALPIYWPAKLLPEPNSPRSLIRTPAGDRVWEGIDRGPEQRRFAQEIAANRHRLIPPPKPCFSQDSEPNAPYDAHHKHPLFLGGEDAYYNLCALRADRHQLGHPALNNQTALLPQYEECGICSGYLTKHPAGQTYYIAGEK